MCQKKTQSRIDCYANATSYYYLDIFGMLCFRTLGPWICAATQWQWYFMSGLYGQKYGIFKVTCLMHAFMGHEIGENIFFYKYSFLTVCPPKYKNGCRCSSWLQYCHLWCWSKYQTWMCDTSFNMYLKLQNLNMGLLLWCMKILRLFLQYKC